MKNVIGSWNRSHFTWNLHRFQTNILGRWTKGL